jgi:hypothetical protein
MQNTHTSALAGARNTLTPFVVLEPIMWLGARIVKRFQDAIV